MAMVRGRFHFNMEDTGVAGVVGFVPSQLPSKLLRC